MAHRAPSPSPSPATPRSRILQHSDSEPALNSPTDKNVAACLKRKFEGKDDYESRSLLAEIRMMFLSFTMEQDKKLDKIQESINEIRTQNAEIYKSIEFLSQEHDEFKNRLDKFEAERKEHLSYISTLENKIENLERKSINTCVEIRNISKLKQNETKNDLQDIISRLGSKLSLNIQPSDIKDIYRSYAKSETHKPIIVEFTSALMKENLISNFKKFNKINAGGRFSTTIINIAGPARPIYLSELLTRKSKRIFFLARDFAKTHEYSFCWTARGHIYLRKQEGAPQMRVDTEEDLAKLKTGSV
ncbi:uncharacterized protein LOC123868359 [Maniola jurtina]|uniref:uncharacterized protein LOC123868359 n=1 Tax=Maniola jurtina TaxID=191418 RepID=UPI001E68D86B|nr:uncharacterized protein LOC123868359 [Maniola jurtina]